MHEEIKVREKGKNMFFGIALTESILALIIILSVLTFKLFLKKPYAQLEKWYAENMTVDIDVTEIIDGAKNEI